MKNNKLMRAASVLLIMALLSTCVIFGTFAKYTSSAQGDSAIKVASWSIIANGDQIAVDGTEPELKFNLFETVMDSDGSAENDVVTGKIAPGTSGAFTLEVVNKSEVTADISFIMTPDENSGNLPIQFNATGAESGWTTSLEKLASDMNTRLAMNGGSKDITVQWRWLFEDNRDEADTILGITASKLQAQQKELTYTLVTTLTATQVD